VLDLHTHFLLGCTALRSTAVATARQTFAQLFRTYGLPDVLRWDLVNYLRATWPDPEHP